MISENDNLTSNLELNMNNYELKISEFKLKNDELNESLELLNLIIILKNKNKSLNDTIY